MLSDCQCTVIVKAVMLHFWGFQTTILTHTLGQSEEKEKQQKQKIKQDYRYKPCCFIGFFVCILISCKNILKYANKGNVYFFYSLTGKKVDDPCQSHAFPFLHRHEKLCEPYA